MVRCKVSNGVPIGGFVAPGFEPVVDAFVGNFVEHGEVGAAFAATHAGRPVVDLWGGVADTESGRPWSHDTVALVFSSSKGIVAVCMALLLDRGLLRLEDPVCRHWPEFAAAGKEAITVGEVLSHRARLPAVKTLVGESEFLDPERMAELLAAQAAESESRFALIYHALTFGWLCGELVRRVDGRSVGRFLAEEVVEPLGLELWLGLPAELEPRVAHAQYARDWGSGVLSEYKPFADDEVWMALWENPPLFPPDMPWNCRAWHAAEIPASNAIGTARSIARLYGALACGGEVDDVRLLSSATVDQVRSPLADGVDPFTEEPMAFGAGFALQTEHMMFGPPASAFGHAGAGGTVHAAWPEERVGFCYVMNELRDDLELVRSHALLDALHACHRAVERATS